MMELQSIPTVVFCSVPFRTLSNTRKASLGVPDLPMVILPHPMMNKKQHEIEALADQVLDEVVRGLTVRPTAGGVKP